MARLVAAVAILLAACGPKLVAADAPPDFKMVFETLGPGVLPLPFDYGAIHEVTVTAGVVTDKALLPSKPIQVSSSTATGAVVRVMRLRDYASTTDRPQPGTVAFAGGTLKTYDVGPGSTECVVRTGDPTELLLCQYTDQGQQFLMMDLSTGSTRRLAAENVVTAFPIRATSRGVFFHSCSSVGDCLNGGAVVVDPNTLAIKRVLADGDLTNVSRGGNYLGFGSGQVNLTPSAACADALYRMRYDGSAEHPAEKIVSAPGMDFRIVDIGDDGGVLYTETQCSKLPDPTAPRTLYFFDGSRTIPQSGVNVYPGFCGVAPPGMGILLSSQYAVVEQQTYDGMGNTAASEIDLVHLCTQADCQPGLTTIVRAANPVEVVAFSVVPSRTSPPRRR